MDTCRYYVDKNTYNQNNFYWIKIFKIYYILYNKNYVLIFFGKVKIMKA